MPRFVTVEEQQKMATRMIPDIAHFAPQAVVYLDRGGKIPGVAIADKLSLPVFALDIKYPFSRLTREAPRGLRPLAWPVKEMIYRLTRPTPGRDTVLPPAGTRILLVDDSASSGKTLTSALDHLETAGVPRDLVLVFVLRCGGGARHLVDLYSTGHRVIFAS